MRMIMACAALAAVAGCAAPGARDRYDFLLKPIANPSEIVAAELAFARAAQEDGQWTAFREYATDDAVMFVPQTVDAQEWLRQQVDPPQAVRWQPHQVWSSCDGSLGVTHGAWQRPDGSVGYFTTVWERQRNGEYKWVMDQGDVLAEPLDAPQFVQTDVASCDPLPPIAQSVDSAGDATWRAASDDRTLQTAVRVDPWCGRIITVSMFRGNSAEADAPGTKRGMEQVFRSQVEPPRSADNGTAARPCEASP